MIALLFSSLMVFAGTEGMPSMPVIQPKRITTVQGHEDFQSQKGFGDKEDQVRAQNMMMVEGPKEAAAHGHGESAAKVSEIKYRFKITPEKPTAGVNKFSVVILDEAGEKPVAHLKPQAEVFMTSMDMGTARPKVTEKSAGTYEVTAEFSMSGPWAVKLIFADGTSQVFNFNVGPKKK